MTYVNGVVGERLKAFIERIEHMEEEKKALTTDIKEIYDETKAVGFEPKIIRKMVSIRKMEIEKRREESAILELYMVAVGMAE